MRTGRPCGRPIRVLVVCVDNKDRNVGEKSPGGTSGVTSEERQTAITQVYEGFRSFAHCRRTDLGVPAFPDTQWAWERTSRNEAG
jgi:hypothetical protein